jgi:hypothetical protein
VALTGVTLCVAFALYPNPILAEEDVREFKEDQKILLAPPPTGTSQVLSLSVPQLAVMIGALTRYQPSGRL